MRVYTTPQGSTYVGYSDLLTLDEWEKEQQATFKGEPIGVLLAPARAHKLGGRKYRGRRFGTGFIFPGQTEDELRAKVAEIFPQLL